MFHLFFYLSQFGEFILWWAPTASKSKTRALCCSFSYFSVNTVKKILYNLYYAFFKRPKANESTQRWHQYFKGKCYINLVTIVRLLLIYYDKITVVSLLVLRYIVCMVTLVCFILYHIRMLRQAFIQKAYSELY